MADADADARTLFTGKDDECARDGAFVGEKVRKGRESAREETGAPACNVWVIIRIYIAPGGVAATLREVRVSGARLDVAQRELLQQAVSPFAIPFRFD